MLPSKGPHGLRARSLASRDLSFSSLNSCLRDDTRGTCPRFSKVYPSEQDQNWCLKLLISSRDYNEEKIGCDLGQNRRHRLCGDEPENRLGRDERSGVFERSGGTRPKTYSVHSAPAEARSGMMLTVGRHVSTLNHHPNQSHCSIPFRTTHVSRQGCCISSRAHRWK